MNAMHASDMTLTYLRGGLSTCSVVWGSGKYFFLTFFKFMMQLCKKFLFRALKTTAHTFSFKSRYACATLFGGARLLRLSSSLGFRLKMTMCNVVLSIFSDWTS